jgi:predicted DNA-binding protein
MVRRKGSIQIAFLVPIDLAAELRRLSDSTRVSQAVYFREAIADLLKKYENTVPKAGSKHSASRSRK